MDDQKNKKKLTHKRIDNDGETILVSSGFEKDVDPESLFENPNDDVENEGDHLEEAVEDVCKPKIKLKTSHGFECEGVLHSLSHNYIARDERDEKTKIQCYLTIENALKLYKIEVIKTFTCDLKIKLSLFYFMNEVTEFDDLEWYLCEFKMEEVKNSTCFCSFILKQTSSN